MSTTTPNFGWTIPSDTDLVTDGAAAMRELGDDIDTAFVDLKGGTTGQILSKASATDLDYTWITNDVGDITSVGVTSPITGGGTSGAVTIAIQDALTTQKGAVQLSDSTSTTSSILAATPTAVKAAYDLANGAIAKTLTTTTGDTIYASSANTPARLAVGTTGQVLTVAAGVPSWATPSAGGMTLLGTAALSGASVTISSISQSYKNLYIVIRNWKPANANAMFTMTFNNIATNNYFGEMGTASTTGTFSLGNMRVSTASTNGTSYNLTTISIPDYTNATTWKFMNATALEVNNATPANYNWWMLNGITNLTTAVSRIDFTPSSGNFSSGDYYIYGVN